MLRNTLALLLSTALAVSGCASAGAGRVPAPQAPDVHATLVEYVQRLPAGSRVRVDRTAGGSIHGILLAAQADRIVVQRATRLPEPAIEIPLNAVARIMLETDRGSFGKAVAIGAGIGAGAVFAFLAILAAVLGD